MPQDEFHTGQGKRHRLFIDAADRLADDTQYVLQDLRAFAIQFDTGQAFFLKSISPTLWAPVKAEEAVPIHHGPFFKDATHVQNQIVAPLLTDDIDLIDIPIPASTSPVDKEELYAMQVSWFGRVKAGGGATSKHMASGIVRRDTDGNIQTFGTAGGSSIGGSGTVNLASPVAYVISGQNARWRVDNSGSSAEDIFVTASISPGFLADVF